MAVQQEASYRVWGRLLVVGWLAARQTDCRTVQLAHHSGDIICCKCHRHFAG